MFDKILVCLDGSKLAEQIIPYATEQARRFGSKVVLFRVIDEARIYTSPAEPNVVVEQMERVTQDKLEAQDYLQRLSVRLRSEGLDVEFAIQEGSSGETIVHYAEDKGMGLIALATHGHGGLGRVVFGSVADYVLRHTSVPVLVIRPEHSG
jgi:nucleotide-binding universal stress UspA family protein